MGLPEPASAWDPTHPIVLFDWQPSRHSDHPREFLKTFSGTVVTDDYQVYHKLAKERRDLKVAGCWIHARRPFAVRKSIFVYFYLMDMP